MYGEPAARLTRRSAQDTVYQAVEGATDSEHSFALFLTILSEIMCVGARRSAMRVR